MRQKPIKIGHIRIKLGQIRLKLGQKFLKTGQFYITRNNPRELLLTIAELHDKIYALKDERDMYKAKLNMVRDLVMNSDKYDDDDFEGCVFQRDILAIIEGDTSDDG